jgi:hypothetical protein
MYARLAGILFAIANTLHAASIGTVTISRPFFNPSLGQHITITITRAPGELTAQILDRDGFSIRTLPAPHATAARRLALEWDGRDDQNRIVPDEAYSLKIERSGPGQATYFPAAQVEASVTVRTKYYDNRGGVLSYQLSRPARIHVQAGTATIDPKTNKAIGPVLKTIVNREPRPQGAVIENWNGYSEHDALYVPSLPHFTVAIAASALPANSIIAYGNKTTTFLAYAEHRSGKSLLAHHPPSHHHQGLEALADTSPELTITLPQAVWQASSKRWLVNGPTIEVHTAVHGKSADAFAALPAEAQVFLDEHLIATIPKPQPGRTMTVPFAAAAGNHVLALNWATRYGPVAVDALPIIIGPSIAARR